MMEFFLEYARLTNLTTDQVSFVLIIDSIVILELNFFRKLVIKMRFQNFSWDWLCLENVVNICGLYYYFILNLKLTFYR